MLGKYLSHEYKANLCTYSIEHLQILGDVEHRMYSIVLLVRLVVSYRRNYKMVVDGDLHVRWVVPKTNTPPVTLNPYHTDLNGVWESHLDC